MRLYEGALATLSYGSLNAVILSEHIDHDWIDANLIKEEQWRKSGVTGEDYYCGDIVFYACTSTTDGNKAYSFRNPENKRRVLEQLPHLVVEANPGGPDLCPGCGGPTPDERPKVRSNDPVKDHVLALHGYRPVTEDTRYTDFKRIKWLLAGVLIGFILSSAIGL